MSRDKQGTQSVNPEGSTPTLQGVDKEAEQIDDILKPIYNYGFPGTGYNGRQEQLPSNLAKERLLTLLTQAKAEAVLEARIDEVKRAANHNNSEYTSDYLEERIDQLKSKGV